MMVNAVRIDARLSNVVLEQDAVSTEELARIDVVSIKKTTFNQVYLKWWIKDSFQVYSSTFKTPITNM